MTRVLTLLAASVLTVVALAIGWRGLEQPPGTEPGGRSSPSPTASPSAAPSETPSSSPSATPTRASVPAAPRARTCHRLSYAQAVAPTAAGRRVPCSREHTAVTYAVGELDTVVDGHLVAVDSSRVRDQVARTCPALFERHVGGTVEQQRLSVLRPIWFTPTVEQSDRGATWYRCDAIALFRDRSLAPLGPDVDGALSSATGRQRYGLCATAEPGTTTSQRVSCSAPHSWRAVRTVALDGVGGGDYPGAKAVRDAGTRPCRRAGRAASGDALDFRWGYEWPTAGQWRGGRTYGICWVPD